MQAPYLLLPVGLGVLLSYFFSHLLLWLGVISKKNHRKFWNVILLLTFLVTAILGLLLAIQINYKLEWKVLDTFLNWHVNFGIAMSLVAIVHFLWHLDYYLRLFKQIPKTKTTKSKSALGAETNYTDKYLVVLTGFIATALQVLLLRELTTVFQGDEIMMAWTIGIWMVLTAVGSFLGKSFKLKGNMEHVIENFLLAIAIFPGLLIIVLNLCKNVIFLPGVMISPLQFVILVSIALAPVCLTTGLLFTLFIRGIPEKGKRFPDVYIYESLGSIAGGIAVSFLLIQWFSVLQSIMILALLVSTLIYWCSRRILYVPFSLTILIVTILLFVFPIQEKLRSQLFSQNKVLVDKETYFGNLIVTEMSDEYNFFLNGSLLFNTGNFIQSEEFVHYAMLQHKNPENVLIVSGGAAGMVHEILKYPNIKNIDYLEINRSLITVAKKLNLLPDTSILSMVHQDAIYYLNTNTRMYDIAILALPDPTSVQLNRYYSEEFIEKLKTKLRTAAVIIYGLNSSGNYMSAWQNAKLSLVYNTLAAEFGHVEIIPGEKDYLIASDAAVTNKIGELCKKHTIENMYVNHDYIDDKSIELRSKSILEQVNNKAGKNTSEKALPVFYSTLKYLSHFHTNVYFILCIPIVLLVILMFYFRRESRGMYVAGFTGASIEVLLIFMFQIAFGYIYAAIGILIAVFMSGLALGAYFSHKLPLTSKTYRVSFLLMAVCMLLLFAFLSTNYANLHPAVLWPIFILFMLIPSGITGFIFVAATTLFKKDTLQSAPTIYAIDLVGSSLGVIIMTLVLIPLIGLRYTCLFLLFLNIIPLLFSFRKSTS